MDQDKPQLVAIPKTLVDVLVEYHVTKGCRRSGRNSGLAVVAQSRPPAEPQRYLAKDVTPYDAWRFSVVRRAFNLAARCSVNII